MNNEEHILKELQYFEGTSVFIPAHYLVTGIFNTCLLVLLFMGTNVPACYQGQQLVW